MSCSPSDLKDYLFGELAEEERRRVAAHVEGCRDCQEELDRLRLTQAALSAVRDEEIPRRIAFVSDRVFERRWWQWLWNSAPRLGFASAALLAAAILVHAFLRPVPRVPSPAVEPAAVEARIQTAVEAAVARSEARQARQTAEAIAAVRKDLDTERQADRAAFRDALDYLQKKLTVYTASASYGGRP